MDTDSTSAKSTPDNSLGLDLQGLCVEDNHSTSDTAPVVLSDDIPQDAAPSVPDEPAKPATDDNGETASKKEKKKPYLNSDRYLTGSNPRDKPSDEELADRITRIREQNEKIKQRRLDVQADVDAFKKTQEEERAKVARTRKLQQGVDQAREQNARRKMDKIQAREWDSGKNDGEWVASGKTEEGKNDSPEWDRQWQRGAGRGSGPRGRGRGRARGRGRGRSHGTTEVAHVGESDTTAPVGESEGVPTTEGESTEVTNAWGADGDGSEWTTDRATW